VKLGVSLSPVQGESRVAHTQIVTWRGVKEKEKNQWDIFMIRGVEQTLARPGGWEKVIGGPSLGKHLGALVLVEKNRVVNCSLEVGSGHGRSKGINIRCGHHHQWRVRSKVFQKLGPLPQRSYGDMGGQKGKWGKKR